MIIDEAQNIKNSNTKQSINVRKIKSDYKLALTGTPVENRLSDLYSIFDYLNPGLLGTPSEFKKIISVLEEKQDMAKLKNIISPFILRRLKTDKKIINDLPEKFEIKKYISLSDKQKLKTLLKEFERNGNRFLIENSKHIEKTNVDINLPREEFVKRLKI